MAEQATPKGPEITARVAPVTEIELEIDESQLELFAECIRRSGKVTLRVTDMGTGAQTIGFPPITKIVVD